ncbi:hypothetical protein ACHHYP_20434 [Achlya hypogyna]|uniref:Uncharacterized protein n=1 Tax=Achlya hypogyna TaxID=1202772 RepID=A0A1V9YMT8_ACHHY|nr:hypothetical protein ACHHYP_20434 [Achlya hypogyna]
MESTRTDTDDQDLAVLVDLDLSPDECSTAASRPKRVRKRYVDEIASLRAKAEEYTQQLETLMLHHDISSICASPWEGISRRQAAERSAAELDNARLKEALAEQLNTIEALLRIVHKRPKLLDVAYVEDWKLQRLPAEPNLRRTNFHAMLDAEFERMESVFLAQRLYDAAQGTHTHVEYDDESDQLQLSCSMVSDVAAPFRLVGHAIWDLFSGNTPIVLGSGLLIPLEEPDSCTRYMLLSLQLPFGFEIQGNMAAKRYDEAHRMAFTTKMVMEDELFPYAAGVYITRETGWFSIEPLNDRSSRIHFYSRGHVPCRSRTAPGPDASFSDLAEIVLAGYRGNMAFIKTVVDSSLAEAMPRPTPDGTFFAS